MHIPDGFLDVKTWVSTAVISVGTLGYSVKKTREQLSDRQIPRLGVMAAFIFAAQMINFPIAGGTSGHLMGAALAAALLGPWSASIVIATVLMIQCLVFQDGGLTALGANIFNMALVGVFVSHLVHKSLARLIKGKAGVAMSAFIASWISVMAASFAVVLELTLSGTIPFSVVFPAMMTVHALIGIGEGLITAVVLMAVFNVGFSIDRFGKEGTCGE